ncbi:DUF2336 domain-containing protein [Bradyrhizobium sediminis]|uniref:DUF2336 domain-containing protein n=1 Tax=Bradyrhizobium sediminis TaxID=2840469 RepID=A0A975NF00_9BRAD|nr:DUF2336 domain-containing protein [Bradyrhizobium sediminis]QWG13913.1 DUF2336 domain-containing protein [Bradyrhizobium sediminis]
MTMFSSLINEIQDTTVSGLTKRQLRALTRIANLFVAGSGRHSKKQIELFDEVFKALVAVIELETRVRLARHIATIPDAPATLVRAFAFDEAVAVAAPVLSQSTALSDCDLVANARTQGQGHLQAIAHRRTISEVITEILIERGEPIVVHTVAKNAGARFSDGSFRELVARAGDDSQLALQVGMRHDIPRHHFLKLLETASASVRARMLAANPQFADAVQDAVTEVIDDINLEIRNRSPDHARARSRVKRLQNWHELGEGNVHAAARAQNFEQAAMALSVLACCPIEMAERAILNENPGVVQVIAKAAGCSWATVKALLLMTAADRRMSEKDLARVREDFERLETRTAKRVLEFHHERRNGRSIASPPVVPRASANAAAVMG